MLTGWRLKLSKLFLIPQRWVIGIMGFTCIMVAYTLRVCLNIAITQMVVSRPGAGVIHDPDACPDLDGSSGNSTSIHGQYNWDEVTQGVILSSFYYGYVVTHVPAGMIAERYGAKHTLGIGVLITAILTLATPAIVKAGGDNPAGLIAVRIIEGLAEGPTSPALAALMSRWVPKTERGRLGSLIFGGAQIGNILGTVVSGFVMSQDGNWPNVFYIFGGLGVLWFIMWSLLVYSEPRTHPFISDEELEFLKENIPQKSEKSVPWRALLSSFALWAIVIAAIGHDWGYFTMVTDLPKYMNDVLKFSIAKTGMLSALPYFIMWISSFCFGAFCDLSIRKNWLSIKNARKIFTTIASMGPGIFILFASYAGCDTTAAVALFCVAMGLMGSYYCGMKVNALDITPNYAGTATALINGIGAVSGIVTPYLVGYLTPDQTQIQWRLAFWIVLAVLFVTNVVYVIFAQGDEQWWNDPQKNGYPEGWKRKNHVDVTEDGVQHRKSSISKR